MRNPRSYGLGPGIALVVLFALAGPVIGVLPYAVLLAVSAFSNSEVLDTLPLVFLFGYAFGGLPAFVAGIVMLLICRRDHPNGLPRAWAAAAIGTGVAAAVFAATAMPEIGASLENLGGFVFGLAFITLLCSLPAATACWWLARRLGILRDRDAVPAPP